MENKNPKALNLDAVRNSDNNVTVGFKCEPELKLFLADEAEKSGLTLSSYVSQLVDFKSKKIYALHEKNYRLTKELKLVYDQLNFFKNDQLNFLYQREKGKNVYYHNLEGKVVNLKISSIEDVYTVIINSFKYQI
jgi:hypothetical protein